jgi:CHAT domain-containing protein/tetratricopeptide (TPR) repeat protein
MRWYGHLLVFFLLTILIVYSQGSGRSPGHIQAYQKAQHWFLSPDASETTDSLAIEAYNIVIGQLTSQSNYNDTLVNSYVNCGILQLSTGSNGKAAELFHLAILACKKNKLLPDSLLFKPYLYTGSLHYTNNELDSAIAWYKLAEALTLSNPALAETERLYNKLGVLYYETGDYRKSIDYFEKALAIASADSGTGNDFAIYYKNNIAASLVRMESYAAALNIYKGLLQYNVNSDQLFANMGFAYQQLGDTRNALLYLHQVKQSSPKQLNNLTGVFLRTGQYDSARFYNNQALSFFAAAGNRNESSVYAVALKHAGDIKTRWGDAAAGLADYQSAITKLVPGFTDTNTARNPLLFTGLQNFNVLFDVLTGKAKAFKKESDSAQQAVVNYRQQALGAYTAALSLARYVERTYSSDDARLFLKTKVNPACSEAVSLALDLYHDTKDDNYLQAAFNYAENNKASVLQAGLLQLELQDIAGLPVSLISTEKKYKSLISRLNIQLAQVGDTIAGRALQTRLRDAELQLSKTQDALEENPAYRRLKFDTKDISLEHTREELKGKHQTLLSYYYTDKQLRCFYITPEETGCSSVNLPVDFFATIASLRKELQEPGNADRKRVNQASTQLFSVLLQPVMNKIKDAKHLVIIPYNEISYLPFELLKNPADGSMLLDRFAISYNYSANFLFDEDAGKDIPYSVLAMAPFTDKSTGDMILPQLPASATEIAGLPGMSVTGSGATRAKFIGLVGDYPVVHLATHAVANDNDPLGGYIEFYGIKTDPDSLHRLYEREVYNLNMKAARLVILSACETGNGMLVNGEGIVSLSRAFSYAGCKSVVTSLWKADDAATAFIIKKLHGYLQKGYSKDEALQQAKIDYLNSPETDDRYKAPAYWAHLVLIGNRDAVVAAGTRWYIPAGVLLVAALLFFVYIKRKRVQ